MHFLHHLIMMHCPYGILIFMQSPQQVQRNEKKEYFVMFIIEFSYEDRELLKRDFYK